MRLWLPLLAGAVLLAGCGEIPQPFRHEGPPPALVRPKMGRGIVVRPVAGPPQLAESVVAALEEREIPAIVSSAPASGHVIEAVPVADGLTWSLTAPDGAVLASVRQPTPPAAWDGPDAVRLKRAATEIAAALAAGLSDPDAQPRLDARPVELARPRVRIDPIAGLPGDGGPALTESLSRALRSSGIDVVRSGAAYVLRAVASVTPAKGGDDLLAVSWQLKRAVGGAQLAAIDQEGEVPRGRLSQPWGALARDIAEGGASGIIQVVRAAERESPAPREADGDFPPSPFTEIRPAAIGKADSSEQKSEARPTPTRAAVTDKAPPKVTPKKPVTAKAGKAKPAKGGKAGPAKAKKGSSSTSPAPRTPKVPAR
jgi:hypothetical protein